MPLFDEQGRYTFGPRKGHTEHCDRLYGNGACNCRGVGLDAVLGICNGDAFYYEGRKYIATGVWQEAGRKPGTCEMVLRGIGFGTFGMVIDGDMSDSVARYISKIVPKAKVRKSAPRKNYAFAAQEKPAEFSHETNSCTVVALAAAFGVPYAVAHAHNKAYGRQDRKGFHCSKAYDAARWNGRKLRTMAHSELRAMADCAVGETVTFGKLLKSGKLPARCILNIPSHVIAVVNGVVMDTHQTGTKARVFGVWEVIDDGNWIG